MPFAGIALGKYVTQQFFPTYVIESMFGVIAAATFVLWFAFERSRTAALIVGLLFAAFFGHKGYADFADAREWCGNAPK